MSDDDVARPESTTHRRVLAATDRYGVVLVLVAATYVVSVSMAESVAAPTVLIVQLATVWMTLRISQARRAVRFIAAIVLGLAAIVAIVDLLDNTIYTDNGGIFFVCCLLYLVAPFAILRHLVLRPRVDRETLLGAVAAYLLIGMFFAFAYRGIAEVAATPFYGAAGSGVLSQDLFFSFVTMTTVGYGNLVPATELGQTLAVMEMVLGQLFLVVAVGKVINSLGGPGRH